MNAIIPKTEVSTDRKAIIKLAGEEYELILTTRATKVIAKKYGGLEHLGEELMGAEHFEDAIDEIVWLITLLANQSIAIYNLWHKDEPKQVLTEEEVELLTTPFDLANYKDAIMECMYKGTKRYVESEDNSSKNTQDE